MRIVERLSRRESNWRELDRLLVELKKPGNFANRRRTPPPKNLDGGPDSNPYRTGSTPVPANDLAPLPPLPATQAEAMLRMAELYRSACADLMMAEAHDLPRETVAYLHDLVARAHNALYRSRGFRLKRWAGELFHTVPRRLRSDPTLRIAALLFWVPLLVTALMAAARPGYAASLLGDAAIESMEQMYSQPVTENDDRNDAGMAGFYVYNNAGIGLQCFAWGLAFGLGTIYVLASNAISIGAAFGHMLNTPYAGNFYHFVTAHSAFELTAIVFAGAAGLRLGWGLIDHQGQTRLASLRREAERALPTLGASVFLFILAAFLEGFVSASRLPYAFKAAIAIGSATLLIVYLALGGRGRAGSAGEG